MNYFKLGAISAIVASACAVSSCDVELASNPVEYMPIARNNTSQFLILIGPDYRIDGTIEQRHVKLMPGEEEERHAAYLHFFAERVLLMTLDSVIEVEKYGIDPDSAYFQKFEFSATKEGYNPFVYVFTDTYLAELADTMRKMGAPPYAIAHEYVVNSTGQDFTLRCVAPEGTWEYAIAAGDSAEVERRWLMEWAGVEGGHYEFVFEDSTQTVWPADARVHSLATAREGDAPGPRRYFDCTVSRDGGGTRRYEITDKLLREIAGEMTILRFTQPGLFGR